MNVTVDEVTKEWIRKLSGAELVDAYRDPAIRSKIVEVMNTPDPTPEEIQAAEEAQAAQAALVEQTRLEAEENAEKERLRVEAESAPVPIAPVPEKKKIVLDYQVTDEKGIPIGRPTHIEAWTLEELIEKQKEAHVQATRYAHRLKTRQGKATFQEQVVPGPARMSDEELIQAADDLKSTDPVISAAAQRKIENDAKAAEKAALELEKENVRQQTVSLAFLRNHITDFNSCKANANIMSDYIKSNNLEWTEDNLELAFLATESQLAPIPQSVSAAPVIQPTPAANPVVEAPVVAAAAPTVTAPSAPVPANPVPVVSKRPAGGIEPGVTLTGRQPVTRAPGLTMKDIAKWDGPTMRAKMKDPVQRAEISRVIEEARVKKAAAAALAR
jgi:hypothetical protein